MVRDVLISPLALYKWDESIFDDFRVPPEIDKDTLIVNILLETAEMSVLYNNPATFKFKMRNWSNKYYEKWKKLYDTTQFEYNPIHNYDRTEESTDKLDGTMKDTVKNKRVQEDTRRGSRDYTDNKEYNSTANDSYKNTAANVTNEETRNYKAAFNNTNGMADSTASSVDGTSKSDGSGTVSNTNNATDNTIFAEKNENKLNASISDDNTLTKKTDDTSTHELHAYGNIGVTTTQQMIQQEREILEFNIVNYITEEFKRDFCILLY